LVVSWFSMISASAGIVVLNSDQSDYTFHGTNTYYITNSVYISGTATFEGGAVIKYHGWGGITAENVDCQTSGNAPVIFTGKDDDRFGETLPDSTGSPSGYYVGVGLQVNSMGGCFIT
jgi:hypothetical protein